MLNNVVLVGNLTRDPECRHVGENSTCVTKFGLAVNRKYSGKEETTFVDVECWGKTAEVVAEYCSKGRQVAVVGRLKQDSWEDKDGNKRSKLFVVAEEVKFVGGRNDSDEPQQENKKPQKAKTTKVAPETGDDDVPF